MKETRQLAIVWAFQHFEGLSIIKWQRWQSLNISEKNQWETWFSAYVGATWIDLQIIYLLQIYE